MKADLAVPGSVSPIERIIDIKHQQIQDIVEYNEQKKSPFRKWVQMNYDDNAYQAGLLTGFSNSLLPTWTDTTP